MYTDLSIWEDSGIDLNLYEHQKESEEVERVYTIQVATWDVIDF